VNEPIQQPFDLQTIAQREAALLAPYAMQSVDSQGRKHAEPEHAYRGPFQRDRDRILHCAAFRRLSGKMQVFTGEMGDYHRTRLTHTHEVASIARTIGRALRLNEDLIEALALFHDIGHPPFGHAGEDALDECLAEEGGFSHNRQAIVIAEELEQTHRPYPGLNLSREVLQGQNTRIDKNANSETLPLLEVQVVDVADGITYAAHDTDDAVKLGLLTLDELAETALIRETISNVQQRFGSLPAKLMRRAIVHELIDRHVSDVLNQTRKQLEELRPQNAEAVCRAGLRIAPGEELIAQKSELQALLYERVYRHEKLIEVRGMAQKRLRRMWEGFLQRRELLPEKFQKRADQVGWQRSVSDYLAGMTDRFCDQQYQQFFLENSP